MRIFVTATRKLHEEPEKGKKPQNENHFFSIDVRRNVSRTTYLLITAAKYYYHKTKWCFAGQTVPKRKRRIIYVKTFNIKPCTRSGMAVSHWLAERKLSHAVYTTLHLSNLQHNCLKSHGQLCISPVVSILNTRSRRWPSMYGNAYRTGRSKIAVFTRDSSSAPAA